MALLFADSFGMYADGLHVQETTKLLGLWASQYANFFITDLGNGRKHLKKPSQATYRPYIISKPFAESATIIVGFRLWNLQNAGEELLFFLDASAEMGVVHMNGGGTLSYEVGGITKLTSVGASTTGEGTHWQIKVVFHNSAGEVYFYREGILDNSITGIDTLSGGSLCDRIKLWEWPHGGFGIQDNTAISDLWIDSTTLHGPIKVAYDALAAAGSSADFTPTGDTPNHACVDEVGPDDDTTYCLSTVSTDLDQLTPAGAITTSKTVIAVAPIVRARKEDASAVLMKLGLKHGGSHSQGSDQAPTEAYLYYCDIFEDVPGGSGWTPAQLAAVEGSYENTT